MKSYLFIVIMLLGCNVTYSQSKADVYNSNVELTWLGIDFSHVYIIGSKDKWSDAVSNADLHDKYFVMWNDMFVEEKAKYDVAKATERILIKYAIETTASSAKAERDYWVEDSDNQKLLDKERIQEIVSKYETGNKTGVGIVFITEGMRLEAQKADIWVVFLDMATKKVLMLRKVEGKASGFGFRNYWAKAFYNGLEEVERNFGKWEKGKN